MATRISSTTTAVGPVSSALDVARVSLTLVLAILARSEGPAYGGGTTQSKWWKMGAGDGTGFSKTLARRGALASDKAPADIVTVNNP